MTKETIINYLTTHKKEFQEKFNVEQIGLFGSYARGEATEESDIDILVKMPPKLFDMVSLKQQIEDDLNKKVDLIREHKYMKPFFFKMIKKDLTYVR